MAQVYFHCSNSRGVSVDSSGAAVGDLAEARDYAACMVRSLIGEAGSEDWRDWVLQASDDLDDVIFVMPFTSLLGKPH
jgi:Domain of unknown function (DUF6894)